MIPAIVCFRMSQNCQNEQHAWARRARASRAKCGVEIQVGSQVIQLVARKAGLRRHEVFHWFSVLIHKTEWRLGLIFRPRFLRDNRHTFHVQGEMTISNLWKSRAPCWPRPPPPFLYLEKCSYLKVTHLHSPISWEPLTVRTISDPTSFYWRYNYCLPVAWNGNFICNRFGKKLFENCNMAEKNI